MKKNLLATFIFNLLTEIIFFGQGKVLESITMKSKIMDKEIRYSVYLPSDYEKSDRSYPVLYLLHGYTDNEIAWVQFGEVNMAADKAISEREIPAMIIVMPDAGVSWYLNDYQGKVRYEDMFFNEFIPSVEKTYRIRAAKEFRAIGGLSMGGFGSLIYSMRHPEMFTACVALSAGIHEDTSMVRKLKTKSNNLVDVYGPMRGDTLPLYWKDHNVLDLANSCPVENLNSVHFYIDCGDKDKLLTGNISFNNILLRRKIPHEFRVRSGEHNWTYWRSGIVEGMKFIGQYFHR